MAGRAGVAIAQGVLLWWLYQIAVNDLWPVAQRGWLAGLVSAVTLVPLAHYVIADLAPPARQWLPLSALAVILLALGWHYGAWTSNEPFDDVLPFAAPLGVLVFHAMPFLQSALTRGRVRPRYEDLFRFAWRNALLGALSLLFAGVFWLLLLLWGELFQMLGIDFFHDLFKASPFAIPATAFAIGIGARLAGSVERLQAALRQQLLALLKWLAPLAMLILALFAAALLVKSPELFSEQRRAISAAWLLWLVALSVALLNAAYQDGHDESPYPRWLGVLIRCATLLLLPVALLAIYALWVRIDNYGFTVPRAWGFLVALVALAYAGGYGWAAFGRGRWMAGMGQVNVAIALFTIAMLTLMLTPPLSPERLAAASQHRRSLEDPAGDAYAYLRFESGRYGRERLARLAKTGGPSGSSDIRMRAARELERDTRRQAEPPSALTAAAFDVFPPGSALEPALLATLAKAPDAGLQSDCLPGYRCTLLFADLNGDEAPEAIVLSDTRATMATRTPAGWQVVDSVWSMRPRRRDGGRDALRQAAEAGNFRIVDLPWQAIEIDGDYYAFTGSASAAGR
ncbi:MAG: DUF4153 domain-containing protein, partial [Burkholderiales bacterium]